MANPPSAGPFAISKILRTAAVEALRTAFETDENYPYVALSTGITDINNTLIQISDVEPIESIKVPTIVVKGHMDREGSIYFMDDLIREVRDVSGSVISEIHGNQLRLNLELEVWAWSSIEREEVVDQTYIYLKTLKQVFADFGIELRLITLIAPREELIGSRVLFISGLSVDTYSEWTVDTTISQDDLIKSFIIKVKAGLIPTTN